MNRHRRIFIFGLDGATWTVLRPLIERGEMPNLKALIDSGISGDLHSTHPPLTPAAWSTFQTGCNPGKHGIIDFMAFDREQETLHFVNATTLRVPTLWQMLSDHGYRVAVVDLPATYPPQKVNGAIVAGLMTPNRESTFTYPASLKDELEKYLGYEWPLLKEEQDRGPLRRDFSAFLKTMRLFIDSRTDTMKFLLEREAPDIAFLQYQCIDFLQHPFWKYLDPSHRYFDRKAYRLAIDQFYRPIDDAIGALLELVDKRMGEETLIAAVSDHGFQAHAARAEINHFLYQNGFIEQNHQTGNGWAAGAELIRKIDVLELRKKIIPKSKKNRLNSQISLNRIDRNRSKAWAVSSFWGYVFLQDDLPASEITRLEDCLHRWTDASTGRKIVRKVHRKHDIFTGPATAKFPDILVEPAPGYTFSSKTYFKTGEIVVPVKPADAHMGTHAREGIFILAGRDLKKSAPWQQAPCDLMDFVPTLLHWLGKPVPRHCDGKVRSDWFEGSTLNKKVTYVDLEPESKQEIQLSGSEEHAIEERLQALGYL